VRIGSQKHGRGGEEDGGLEADGEGQVGRATCERQKCREHISKNKADVYDAERKGQCMIEGRVEKLVVTRRHQENRGRCCGDSDRNCVVEHEEWVSAGTKTGGAVVAVEGAKERTGDHV